MWNFVTKYFYQVHNFGGGTCVSGCVWSFASRGGEMGRLDLVDCQVRMGLGQDGPILNEESRMVWVKLGSSC